MDQDRGVAGALPVALGCSRCGAPLVDDDDDPSEITCRYCEQVHRFASAPATQQKDASYAVGDAVIVRWGNRWWDATVLDVPGPGAYRIRYDGWSSSWDETVGPERIAPRSDAARRTVHETKPRRWPLIGCGLLIVIGIATSILTSPGSRTGPPGQSAPPGVASLEGESLEVDQELWVEWNGFWYRAKVVSSAGRDRFRIHYLGWADSFDEEVPRSRIRVDGE